MAVRVLLDHEVLEENISLVSLLMAESGVQTIAYAQHSPDWLISEHFLAAQPLALSDPLKI